MKTAAIFSATDQLGPFIEQFLPASQGLRMDHLVLASNELTLVLASSRTDTCCPVCQEPSKRVHSRYQRTLLDLPWGHMRVQLHLLVHRFFCDNPCCIRKIFTERLNDLAEPYARRTNRLREALLALGWALGGEAGARQCARHALPISAATMLRLLRSSGTAVLPTPRVLGVDDWSFQARSAGTLLVDLEQHRPVEVLLGSDEKVLSAWLLAHPGVEIICRDRGSSYLKGASIGAPQAKQVLDRWHVLKNMGEVLQKILAQHMDVLQQAAGEAAASETASQVLAGAQPLSQSASQAQEPGVQEENPSSLVPASPPLVARSRKPPQRKPAAASKQRLWQLHMYEQVHRLSAEGWSGRAIARYLCLHPQTVRKYLRLEQFADQRHNPHGSCVEPYRAYLQERWAQGCRMVKTLWQERKALGFTGSYKSVCLFTRTFLGPEAGPTTSPSSKQAVQQPRTPWQTKWLFLHEPEELSAPDASYREAICRLSPELAQAACLARRFVHMVRERKTDSLDGWLEEAKASPLQELHHFALGLTKE